MTARVERAQLRQRADYTHKFNLQAGRHGWLRLTPAYSVKIVEELMVGQPRARRVLDPFCGTGTTALSAAYHGHECLTTDINPFLVWLAQAKIAQYSQREIAGAKASCRVILDLVERQTIMPVPIPPIHNIERWWNPQALQFLRLLRAAIEHVTEPSSAERRLLSIAFCRTLIALSNAAFNHQSMSFKDNEQLEIGFRTDMAYMFSEDIETVLQGANKNPRISAHVLLGDARNLSAESDGLFDLVITSPPYANRMSYIRELRPYMYWLEFLHNGRDAGELDWAAIGGTWGIATSRLNDWKRPPDHFQSERLDAWLDKIAHADNKNGALLAKYLAKYFDDMWGHFQGLIHLLDNGAELHYIVGNSSFYGVLVSTEILYAEMLARLGFAHIECHPLRKRNSKKELVEFDVFARWRD